MPKIMDGPIPGQSLTKPPGSYAHEKPPQFTEEQKALEYVFNDVLGNKKNITKFMVLIKGGLAVTEITNTFLYGGIMAGKWSLDLAFLMYQEVAWMFAAYAKIWGIKYTFKKADPDYEDFLMQYQDYITQPTDDEPVEKAVNSLFSGLGI